MKRLALILTGAASLLVGCGPAQDTDHADIADNPRLAALFAEDQAARKDMVVSLTEGMADARRQADVRRLLAAGQVRSGADYARAAFILQHGARADDYLLAHALATAALSQGHADAAWIAAASLDRYLQATGRPQIYGTQFVQTGAGTTRGAFDSDFMPDSLRRDTRVLPLAEQTAPPPNR
ncbi:hypothetical protein [Brevundimonas guildfordensis]|uniref:Lipoprotein n=1 Tax=Brevundimonas guildfordensis TaxID=2762241 RepID=A0ABR8R0G5_9CAUL|nr:hypothetical protein [Brevundimonas guildfordensis]MBD7941266.1 hypothetical protein [Brevundimonas guildfordensis]